MQPVIRECEQVTCCYVKVAAIVYISWNSKYAMVKSLGTNSPGLNILIDCLVSLGGHDHLTYEEWLLLKDNNKIMIFKPCAKTIC